MCHVGSAEQHLQMLIWLPFPLQQQEFFCVHYAKTILIIYYIESTMSNTTISKGMAPLLDLIVLLVPDHFVMSWYHISINYSHIDVLVKKVSL